MKHVKEGTYKQLAKLNAFSDEDSLSDMPCAQILSAVVQEKGDSSPKPLKMHTISEVTGNKFDTHINYSGARVSF